MVVPWDQEYGGVASVVGNIGRHIQRQGHTVMFLHPGETDSLRCQTTKWNFPGYELNLRPPCVQGVRAKSIAAFVFYLLPTIRQLGRLLSQNKIEVVNIHYPGEHFVYFALLRKLGCFKLVVSVHGADLFPDGKPQKAYSRTIRFLMRSADLVVTPSRSTLQDVLAVFPHIRSRAIFIHNAVNMSEFLADESVSEVRTEYVLCVANHNVKKAIDVLLRAFNALDRTHEKVELWLVGDGPLREDLDRLARTLHVDHRVRFLGSRSREEIKRYMKECLFFVLPSRAEPFGIVILEALASRKAVVTTFVGGIPEIIRDGVTGLLVEPDNPDALAAAMRVLLRDEALRERLANSGYESVKQRFEWDVAGARYESAFRTLLGTGVERLSGVGARV